jgi:putative oxidoreductase
MNALIQKLPAVTRIFLGLVFFVFGLNGFLHFLPEPPLAGPPGDFVSALLATGYMMPLIKGTEVVGGLLLLGDLFVPLAIVVLAPIVVNIVGFHAVLAPSGAGMALILVALEVYLAWAYRDAFAPLLRARTRPSIIERSELDDDDTVSA